MEIRETSLADVVSQIETFYQPRQWHFVTMNAIDTGENLLIQWLFNSYEEKDVTVAFTAPAGYDEPIPSVNHLIPSAWIAEAEMKDLLGANVEGTPSGLFLEEDSNPAPLRKNP